MPPKKSGKTPRVSKRLAGRKVAKANKKAGANKAKGKKTLAVKGKKKAVLSGKDASTPGTAPKKIGNDVRSSDSEQYSMDSEDYDAIIAKFVKRKKERKETE
ncbi:MAG: hypothetical protein GY705_29925, partial [Bacteroidetes bacterium]|nr:hypothetical protein [Bacteroidota bacterium]